MKPTEVHLSIELLENGVVLRTMLSDSDGGHFVEKKFYDGDPKGACDMFEQIYKVLKENSRHPNFDEYYINEYLAIRVEKKK